LKIFKICSGSDANCLSICCSVANDRKWAELYLLHLRANL